MDEKTATRDRILHAALNRIKHYGYGKTTMAEIAADCAMSPGNIYRFFEAKIDIAEAIVRKHYTEELAELSTLTRRTDLAAPEKLRELLLRRMRDNFHMLVENPKILEVSEVIGRERPLFIAELVAMERVLITAVIEEGVRERQFRTDDPVFTGEVVQDATVRFRMPQLLAQKPLPKLERDFHGVMDLLLRGLATDPAKSPAVH